MKKFLIEDVKVGVSKGGIACGPVSGSVVAEVCIWDQEAATEKFCCLTEVEGIPNFVETDESTYDRQIEEVDDQAFWDMLNAHSVDDFSDYWDVYEALDEAEPEDREKLLVWKYLVYMTRSDWDEIDQLKAKSVGKCLGDFTIPVCDMEQDYLDEKADEESDEEESETLEEMIDDLSDEFEGLEIDTSGMDLEEGETAEGSYSSETFFREGQDEYKLKYSFEVNDEAEILYVNVPEVEKLVGSEYVPCPEGEVSAERICEVLRETLNGWL